jgi:hypothetical protein
MKVFYIVSDINGSKSYISFVYGLLCLHNKRRAYFTDFRDVADVIKNIRLQVRHFNWSPTFSIKSLKIKKNPGSQWTNTLTFQNKPKQKNKGSSSTSRKLYGQAFFESIV